MTFASISGIILTLLNTKGVTAVENVIQLFNNNSVTVYRIVDPGVTWYEENQTVSAIQLKNDATSFNVNKY